MLVEIVTGTLLKVPSVDSIQLDPAANEKAIAIAQAIRDAALAGVRDVVATYRTVAVYFDPLITSADQLYEGVEEAIAAKAHAPPSRLIEVPVVYGGEHGPDLEAVAAYAGVGPETVIARHMAPEYRVFMLGFLPGFAYMGVVDESIALGRHADPRLRVPAGSVGIAGRQTGIYPTASPGGWQLIGRTGLRLFDVSRVPAALFQAGDRVRFVKVPDLRIPATGAKGMLSSTTVGTPAATVVARGLLTTVQDSGRWGAQASGVSVCGAMDSVSYRLANLAVGNPADAAVLEATITGPEVRFEQPVRVAVAGADISAEIDGQRIPLHAPFACGPGSVLRFGERKSGARAYIALGGGIDAAPVLGSRSTHVLTGIGGRVLEAGDTLAAASPAQPPATVPIGRTAPLMPRGGARLRILRGPQVGSFPQASLDRLVRNRFVISAQSNRMAYRLTGEPIAGAGEMVSDATFTGAIQIPPSGHPILLMHDRQTVGGYPQIAVVISADLPRAGQLAPGDWVEFAWCGLREAISALRAQEALLAL